MPLWSLTQERVDRLRRQIGDVEVEVDKLIKLTKEDLWRRDLDLFIEEWRVQLDDEHKRKRRINNMGRRTSRKVTVSASGPTVKKRKGLGDYDGDDDFEDRPRAKKPAVAKVQRTEIIVEKKKEPLLKAWLSGSGTQGKNPAKYHDGNSSEVEPGPELADVKSAEVKKGKPATKSRTIPVLDKSNEEDVVKKPAARKPRAAASKPVRYDRDSDSEASNGDDLLGDITNMVKGLPGGNDKSSTDQKSLFSTSRAITNGNASLKAAAPMTTKNYAEISEDDTTNFMALVPQPSPRRSINVTKNVELTDDEDEDRDDVRPLTTTKSRSKSTKPPKAAATEKATPVVRSDSEADSDKNPDTIVTKPKSRAAPSKKANATSKPPKAAAKPPAAKRNPAPKKSKPTSSTSGPAPAKKAPLSPAAKAYAAKQAKNNSKKNRILDSDDEDDAIQAMADDLLDSPSVGPTTAATVAAAAAAAAKEVDSDVENWPPPAVPRKAATATGAATSTAGAKKARPARRAAVEAATKKKPVYFISDEEDEQDDHEDGDDDDADLVRAGKGGFDDDSEDDYDESF